MTESYTCISSHSHAHISDLNQTVLSYRWRRRPGRLAVCILLSLVTVPIDKVVLLAWFGVVQPGLDAEWQLGGLQNLVLTLHQDTQAIDFWLRDLILGSTLLTQLLGRGTGLHP